MAHSTSPTGTDIQDSESGLPRILLLRGWVNKDYGSRPKRALTSGMRSLQSSSDKTRPIPNRLDVFQYGNIMAAMARAATTSDAFNAIAEQQRRDILALLRAGERPVTDLAQELGMSQPRAAAGPRVGRRIRAVLEREFRPAGHLRAGPQADTAGGMTDGRGKARNAGGAGDGRPGDHDLPGHRRPAGVGVRGIQGGPAPVAVVGAGGVHHHHAVLRVPRGRSLGLRDARPGRDRLPGVDHLDRDRPTGADRAAAR